MGLVSSLVHAAGNVIGPAEEAYGALTGNQQATQLGHDITNPNVTLHSAGPAMGGYMSYTPQYQAQQHQMAVKDVTINQPAKAGSTPGAQTGASTNLTTGTTSTTNPGYQQLMDAYNNEIGQYQNDYNSVPLWQQAATNNENAIYNAQAKTYNDQLNQGNSQLDQQTHVLNDSYNRSLNQLANNMRTQNQGFQNALGIGGAGDSSAAQMGAYAMANEQNINRGYMNQDLNNQLDQIALQRSGLKNNYDDEMGQIVAQHQSDMTNIAQQYGQMQKDILHNISMTNAQKASANAYLGQWANNQIQNLDANLSQRSADINSKYATLANTQQNLTYQPNYQATVINPQTVSAQQYTSQQVAPTAPLAPNVNNNNQNQMPLAAPTSQNQNNFSTL